MVVLSSTLEVGLGLTCFPGSVLAGGLGVPLGAYTILRRIRDPGRPSDVPATRVLGVDEWAWRKRERYGTILMDLERRRVVDLLPVRSAETFACWLRAHPGVEFIARCLAYPSHQEPDRSR